MHKTKNWKATVIFSAILFLIICLGLCVEAFYSLPDGDDFGFFYLMKRGIMDGNGPIQAALHVVDLFYNNWSGDYGSVFIISFVNPFYRAGLYGYSFCCFLGVCAFFLSLFIFLKSYRDVIISDSNMVVEILFGALFIAGWLDAFTPKEIFYWYTCVYSYCIGLTIKLMICSFLLINYRRKSMTNMIASCLFLFICGIVSSAVGTQNLTISIGLYIFFIIIGVLRAKWYIASLGGGIMVSAVIVLLAPGNHARAMGEAQVTRSVISRMLIAFGDSTRCIARMGIKNILASPFFWLSLVLIVVLRLFTNSLKKKELTFKMLIKRFLASCILIYSAIYPVCYGYQVSFLSPRTECVAGFIAWVLAIYWMVRISQIIPQLHISYSKGRVALNSALAGWGGLFFAFFIFGKNAGILAYRELFSGKPQMQWENWNQIYTEVEESNEKIVTIDLDNEYINGLMTRHDEVEWNGENVISRSYMAYCEKEEVVVNWHTGDDVYTLYGYKGPLAIEYQ